MNGNFLFAMQKRREFAEKMYGHAFGMSTRITV